VSENPTDPLILSHDELVSLTGRTRYGAQAKTLAQMGFAYRIRPDGSPVVSRTHFEAIMGANTPSPSRSATEPNWDALNAA